MGILAQVMVILGALCAIMGIITAALGGPILVAGFTMIFWFALAGILRWSPKFGQVAKVGFCS